MTAAVADHVWQSTALVILAAGLACALRGNRASVRYWIWFAASVKFLVPFALLMQVGRRLALAAGLGPVAWPTGPAVSVVARQVAEPFSRAISLGTGGSQGPGWALVLIVFAWACGAFALSLTRVQAWRRLRRVARASVPLTLTKVPFPAGGVRIRSSRSLLEPGVIGWWRPVVAVPANIEDHLTAAQLEAVLAHEVCHVRRRDNLTAGIHMVVESLFWFHPLVWWVGARLVEERERACDEHVVGTLREPQAYAEGILAVCRLYFESPLACVSAVTGSNIKKRIEDIMTARTGRKLDFARKAALAAAAALTLAAPVGAGIVTARVEAQAPTVAPAASTATREAALKHALQQIRQALDKYHADKKQYPRRLESLVRAGYLEAIPTDPFTGRSDSWQTIAPKPGAPAATSASAQGVFDVRSGSRVKAADGTKYSAW